MICLIVFKLPDNHMILSGRRQNQKARRAVFEESPRPSTRRPPLLLSCITACAYLGGLATLQHGFPTLHKKEVTIHSKDLSVTSGTISKRLI